MRRFVLGLISWPSHLLFKVSPHGLNLGSYCGPHTFYLRCLRSSWSGLILLHWGDSCGSKILYHHVDLEEITATDLIEKESCGALFAIFHLIFYVWNFYVFLLDNSTHTNSLLVSSPFIIGGHTPLIRCFCNSSSFHPCMH